MIEGPTRTGGRKPKGAMEEQLVGGEEDKERIERKQSSCEEVLRVRIEGKVERKGSELKKDTPEKTERRLEKAEEVGGKRKKNSKQQTHQERLKEFMASYTSEAPT